MGKRRMLLIAGESGAGKDTLGKILKEKYGLKPVCSYATRPMRPGETEGVEHKFRTPEEAHAILESGDVLAYTKIGEIEYFAMYEDLMSSDMYIIDPNGISYLKEKYPHLPLQVVYVTCKEETRRNRALKRGDKPEVIDKRFADEREQFASLTKYDYRFDNDGELKELEVFAEALVG